MARQWYLPSLAPRPPRTWGVEGAIWKDFRTTWQELDWPLPRGHPGLSDGHRPDLSYNPREWRAGKYYSNPPMSSGRAGAGPGFRNQPLQLTGLQPRGCSRPLRLLCFCRKGSCFTGSRLSDFFTQPFACLRHPPTGALFPQSALQAFKP